MNQDREEKQIRQLYDELRSQDERIAHSFSRDWREARARDKTVLPFRRHLRITAGVAASLALGIVLVIFRPGFDRQSQQPQQLVCSITEWESITDSLLEIPGERLMTTLPQLDYSNLDAGLYPSDENPEDNRSAS